MFALRTSNKTEFAASGINFKQYNNWLEGRKAKFDLMLEVVEGQEGITFNLEYCTRLFKKETIKRFGTHYISVLEEITACPEKGCGKLMYCYRKKNSKSYIPLTLQRHSILKTRLSISFLKSRQRRTLIM